MFRTLRRDALLFTLSAAIVATLGVLFVYGGQTRIGFFYDDYHFVRPLLPHELHRVWFGTWDLTGIESVFFRPLTAWMFAARFWLFGFNASAMHLISVTGHAVCAVLLGWFLRRERASAPVTLLGVWLYAIHSSFPFSQVSWLTNQMHLAESCVVLIALLIWQSVRDRSLVWWLPLAACTVIAFLLKEDGLMLAPVILALTVVRAWFTGSPLPRRYLLLVLCAGIVMAGLVGLRYDRLGQLGGYGVPSLDGARLNLWKGLKNTLMLLPAKQPWQPAASAFAIGTIVIGLGVAIWRWDRHALFLIAVGLTIACGFNLPFALVTKVEQYHLVTLGAVLALAGASQAVWVASPPRQWVLGVALVAASLPLGVLARHLAAGLMPCAQGVLYIDSGINDYWVVPVELKPWFDLKRQRCAAGQAPPPLSTLPIVSWGLYDQEHDDAVRWRWTSDAAVLIVRRDMTSLSLGLRRPGATARQPVNATIRTAGTTHTVTLDSDAWQYTTIHLTPGVLAWLRQGQRIDVAVTPWMVPALLDPRSTDLRRLGAELQIIDLR